MKKFLTVALIMFAINDCVGQKISLDDLLRLNSKSIVEIREILKSKGYWLTGNRTGPNGESNYTWYAKDGVRSLIFTQADLNDNSSSLNYSSLTKAEYEAFKKQLIGKGFKLIPYKNFGIESQMFVYKKGEQEISFLINQAADKGSG